MAITNTTKPTTTLTNTSKVSSGETWATILTTWATETRTWESVGSFFTNTGKNFASLWAVSVFPWQLALPWQIDAGMTNTPKP